MGGKEKTVLSLLKSNSDICLRDVVDNSRRRGEASNLQRKDLRKIYGPARNELTRDYERRKNTNLESLYNKPTIKCFLKAKPLEWAGYVWRAEGSII
ncbi:putative transposon-derived protein F52C9.6 [Aphis craccivora]|uniref:Putative transposon-derived protein F52C9.6 n=1 Tax=Aphis craccivora TaxID=307492 RepID=A0A6G0YJX6_APHCR|nr:putative transposon-derived protein F52C9.6 [Aphis craccivora]